MNPLADLLEQYPVLVVDGALATELEHGVATCATRSGRPEH